MAHASIDVGSNSILLTVVSDDGAILHDEARVVGMSRGVGDVGQFATDRIAAADAVLADYVAVAGRLGVEAWGIKGVATSGARRAMNASTWLARVHRKLGLRVRIITGDEEALLTWKGAHRDLDISGGPRMVVDLGGGSTEVALGDDDEVCYHKSLEIGSVRLTESFLVTTARDGVYQAEGLRRLRQEVALAISQLALPAEPDVVVGVAGSVTSLMAMALGQLTYDGAALHGAILTREHLAHFTDLLLPLGRAERRIAVPAAPERSDYLLAAVTILDQLLVKSHRANLVCSDRGLRFGLLPSCASSP